MRNRNPGDEIHRKLGATVMFFIGMAIFVKMQLDFVQLLTTGHNTNFLFFLGDIFVGKNQPLWATEFIAWLMLTLVSVVVYYQVRSISKVLLGWTKIITRFLAQYEIRKKDGILKVSKRTLQQ